MHRASTATGAILSTSPTTLSDVTAVDNDQKTTTPLLKREESSLPVSSKKSAPGSVEDRMVADARAMAARGRQYSVAQHQPSRRLVQKSGDCNVAAQNITKRKRKFLVDLFTTMVDMRWRWHIVAFIAVFVVTWTAFAAIWLLIAALHGDLATTASSRDNNNNNTNSIDVNDAAAAGDNMCVDNVYDLRSALLFSIETQATIG